jgi:hypothetical protein
MRQDARVIDVAQRDGSLIAWAKQIGRATW